jgi:hypothetical protein
MPPLYNQPTVETRFEGGAFRIVDIKVAPARRSETPVPPVQSPIVSLVPETSPAPPGKPETELIRDFLVRHHRKAEAGNVPALMTDYADRVEFLKGAPVNRTFIEAKETKDRKSNEAVKEYVLGNIAVQLIGEGRYEARYKIHAVSRSKKDNSVSDKEVPLLVEIELTDDVPQIVKQVVDTSAP